MYLTVYLVINDSVVLEESWKFVKMCDLLSVVVISL
jgi:hypothetical protein